MSFVKMRNELKIWKNATGYRYLTAKKETIFNGAENSSFNV